MLSVAVGVDLAGTSAVAGLVCAESPVLIGRLSPWHDVMATAVAKVMMDFFISSQSSIH